MTTFNLEEFAKSLVAEALFYDDEYGAFGNLSLIDYETGQERFLASYNPDEGNYLIEEGTQWEDYEPEEGDEIGYALAVDGAEYGSFETAEEAARVLLDLARDHRLFPSIIVLFEEEQE